MSSDEKNSRDYIKPRGQKRVELETKVNMEFERFSGFISEFSHNISEGGMFIRTEEPQAIGSVFSFEFKLRDNIKLIQGWGEVAWIRDVNDPEVDEQNPPGMGIKFVDLDDESRSLIKRITNTEKRIMSEDGKERESLEEIMNDDSLFADAEAGEQPGELESDVEAASTDFDPDSLDGGTERIFPEGGEFESVGSEEVLTASGNNTVKWIVVALLVVVFVAAGYFLRQPLTMGVQSLLAAVGLMSPPTYQSSSPKKKTNARKFVGDGGSNVVKVPDRIKQMTKPTSPSKPVPKPKTTANTEVAAKPQPPKAAAPPPAPAREVSLPPAKRIVSIRLVEAGSQGTVFEIKLDGGIDKNTIKFFQTEDPPPRLVVDLPGMQEAYPDNKIRVKDSRVNRLRLGWHSSPRKVRIVFDLAQNFVGRSELQVRAGVVRVRLFE